jgi:hypothetical protein
MKFLASRPPSAAFVVQLGRPWKVGSSSLPYPAFAMRRRWRVGRRENTATGAFSWRVNRLPYPLASSALTPARVPVGSVWHHIFLDRFSYPPGFGFASSRFSDPRRKPASSFGAYDAGQIFEVAFLETIVLDLRNGNPGALVLDLRGGNAVALGVPANALRQTPKQSIVLGEQP